MNHGVSVHTAVTELDPEKELLPEGALLRLNDWSETGAWALAVLAAVAGALVLWPLRHGHIDSVFRPLLGLTWLAFAALIAGGARSGVIVDSGGITVRGLVRRQRWEWSEISDFELKRPIYRAALRIRFTNGSEASAPGFNARSSEERKLAEARVAELNRRAAAGRRE
jgi:hypothetical protein